MPRFLIERDIPNAGAMTPEQLADATQHSNAVLAAMDADIQWRHSYVAGDRIYCVYDAASEGLTREHAERSGFPANRITPVAAVIGPDFACSRGRTGALARRSDCASGALPAAGAAPADVPVLRHRPGPDTPKRTRTTS